MVSLQKRNNDINKQVMCSVLVTYDPSNQIAQGLMNVLSITEGVELDNDVWITQDEIKRMEKSEKSGYASLDDLKKILRQ